MRECCCSIVCFLQRFRFLPLLFFRAILAYGFFKPLMMKMHNLDAFAGFLASMNVPFPHISAFLAMLAEIGVVFLVSIGLFTRIFAIPGMIVMLVAIFKVHWVNGFVAANNGFEIPLYYLLMLFALFIMGPGAFSVDGIIKRSWLCKDKK